MATTFTSWRPSTLAAACAPVVLVEPTTYVVGQPAVAIVIRTAPTFGHVSAAGGKKINNYMGTIASAKAEGATTSGLNRANSAAKRIQPVQGDKVKGGDARGIPPRGRPV